MTLAKKSRIAITMGDPAGVGPEVIVAAWDDPTVRAGVHPLVLGHAEIMRRAVKLLQRKLEIIEVDEQAVERGDWPTGPTAMAVLPTSDTHVLNVPLGRIDPRAGEAAYRAVCAGTKLALDGQVDAIVTAPLSK